MEESRPRSVELVILAAQAIGTLGLLGLAVYGVFFSDLSDAVRARLETTIAEEREENVELRRERRTLQTSVDSLAQRREQLAAEVSQLRSGWNRYLGQIYDQFLHDLRSKLSNRLDELEAHAQRASEYREFTSWLAEGRKLRQRLKENAPQPPDSAKKKKLQKARSRLGDQYYSLMSRQDSLLGEDELDRAVTILDSARVLADSLESLFDAEMELHRQDRAANNWVLVVMDSAGAWSQKRPSTWRARLLQLTDQQLARASGSDTAIESETEDSEEVYDQLHIRAYERRLGRFDSTVTGPPSSALTGAQVIKNVLATGILRRFLPRHQKQLTDAIDGFIRENPVLRKRSLQVRLPKGWTPTEVEKRATAISANLEAVREASKNLRSFLERHRTGLLK